MRRLLAILVLGLSAVLPLHGAVASHSLPRWAQLPPTPVLPTPVAQGLLPVNGVQLYYARFGHGDPVLLLHGGAGNANWWGSLVPVLVAAGHEVVVLDSRGHGRSTRSAEPYSYGLMAADVIGVLDALGLRSVALIGWSDGGIIGLDLAIHHPERLRGLLTFGANSDLKGVREDALTKPTVTEYLTRSAAEYEALSSTPQAYEAFIGAIEQMWQTQPAYTATELASIRVPTTIADGAHDEMILRSHSEYLARSIPKARLRILEDVSHFGLVQNPDEFAALATGFLRALPPVTATAGRVSPGSVRRGST
jgi:pimeloyl-ACP methyl ester carboxylesterase